MNKDKKFVLLFLCGLLVLVCSIVYSDGIRFFVACAGGSYTLMCVCSGIVYGAPPPPDEDY